MIENIAYGLTTSHSNIFCESVLVFMLVVTLHVANLVNVRAAAREVIILDSGECHSSHNSR